MSKIKICGLSRTADIDCVNKYLPDFAGFVFYPPSHRNVTAEQAVSLKARLDKRIKAVGVFVDAEPEFILSLCDDGVIDYIQLHGNEDEDYIKRLKEQTDRPIIKAFKIKGHEDIASANRSVADFVLLDTFVEGEVGGTGKAFDHSLLYEISRDYFLAGGITADNLGGITDSIHPYCVDLSSGVETDRVKDENKIKAVMQIMRR